MAKSSEWWRMEKIIAKQKEYIKKVFSYCDLDEESGIYIFVREDTNKNKFAYVGQAKHLLTRVNEHVNTKAKKSHIDRSIVAHGIKNKFNENGYFLRTFRCPVEQLDEKEKFFISFYQNHNYNLLNVTSGGQDVGHNDLNYRQAAKGYYDGLKQGKKNTIKEIAEIMKYLKVIPNQFKMSGEPTEIAKRKLAELKELLTNEDNNTETESSN